MTTRGVLGFVAVLASCAQAPTPAGSADGGAAGTSGSDAPVSPPGSGSGGSAGIAVTDAAADLGAAGAGQAGAGTGQAGAGAGATGQAGSMGAAGALPDASAGDADASTPRAPLIWTPAAACPLARFEAVGAVYGTKLIVMGGFVANVTPTARVDAFDLATGMWSQRKDMPTTLTHPGVAADGNLLYLAGGFTGAFTQGIPMDVADVWVHDTAADTWTPGPPLPARRAAIGLARVGRTLHAVGGLGADSNSDTDEHLVLTLGGTTWTPAPALPNGRNHLGAAVIGDLIYMVGGRHGWDEVTGHQRTLNRFDPVSGKWATLASLDIGRSEIAAATFVSGGQLFVVGGSVAGMHPTAEVWRYDPGLDRWSAETPLPAARKGAVAAAIGNKIVVTTGSPTSTDPAAQTWIGCCLQ